MADDGSTPTNRSPIFWMLVSAGAVAVAIVVGFLSYDVVSNEPIGEAAKDRSSQGQLATPQPSEADRSTGSVSSQPARPAGPVENPSTTTSGQPGAGSSSR